jgi:hypothetical protein
VFVRAEQLARLASRVSVQGHRRHDLVVADAGEEHLHDGVKNHVAGQLYPRVVERQEARAMRDDAVDEPQVFDLGVVEDVLGGPRLALLRVAAPRPGAAGPAWFYRDALGGREELMPNARKGSLQCLAPATVQLGQGVARWAREVHPPRGVIEWAHDVSNAAWARAAPLS